MPNYLALASFQRMRGDDAGAEATYKLAAAINPPAAAPLFLLVDLMLAQQRSAEAVTLLQQMSQKGPDPVASQRRLAELYLELGDNDKADKEIKALMAQDKGDPQNRYLRARMLLVRGDVPAGTSELEQVLKQAPSFVAARF